MRVAYFSPLPPERSGIADYSALLIPVLRQRLDLEVVPRGTKSPPRGTDISLYHVGNEVEAHGWIVGALQRHPGLVVLHEFALHHLIAGMTLARGDRLGYLEAMYRDAGVVGRLLAHGVMDGLVPPIWETCPEDFPLVGEVIEPAEGLIVHSAYVERRVRETGYEKPVWRVPHPAWPTPARLPAPELPEGRSPLVGCFGYLNPPKRLPQLLEAFSRLRSHFPRALLVLAGTVDPSVELGYRLDRLGLQAGIDVLELGYVEEERLWALMAACDVCVSLRSPTMGETSGSALRALSLGRPLVVSDVGWFSELPDSVAAKVPVDVWEVDTLAATLELLAGDPDLRSLMGVAARAYTRREHDLERVAEAYAAAIEAAAGAELVRESVLHEIAASAADVGLASDGREIGEIATRLRELELV